MEVELLLFYFIVEIHTKVNNKLRTKKSVFSHLICKIIQNISHYEYLNGNNSQPLALFAWKHAHSHYCGIIPYLWGLKFHGLSGTHYPSINVPHVKSKQSLFMIYTSGSMNLHQTPRTSYEKLKIQEKLAQLILNDISQYIVHNYLYGKLDFLTTIACMCDPLGNKPQSIPLYK